MSQSLMPLTSNAPVIAGDRPTAVVYCEANFGETDGKTANGLVRYSETYEIVAVIDSRQAGHDAGVVLDEKPNDIPVCRDLADALAHVGGAADAFIFGVAPSSGMLSAHERTIVLDAIATGMDIVNGLHEFLNEDAEFVAAALAHDVHIFDVRRPRAKKDLRMFTGRIAEVTCPRIAVLGTDGAIGKRTTATVLTRALRERGVPAVMVSTGQTGLIQGGRYGIALDAIPSQFCSGEMEATVVEAFETEHPDVIVIEGQGALSHPAYLTSTFILRGSRPDAVVLQHAPGRTRLGDFGAVVMPTPASEINLIETFAATKVIGLAINHENMTDADVSAAITRYETELGIPATDALTRPEGRLVDMVLAAFPELEEKLSASAR
ncbi:DUF1611 domain-containing protein [Mumia sp.]|uniref:DUF1611 domain-containing protein n=1 Tax=Mumia sp. TaxID=1965300 RepID=UPI00261FF654|nr:DUF1611 domain-containing protein [Mumia sp.]MDD9349902.1 DUF1611 domain-containing protein [Mumia sp.]